MLLENASTELLSNVLHREHIHIWNVYSRTEDVVKEIKKQNKNIQF